MSKLKKYEKEMDDHYKRNRRVHYGICNKIENEVNHHISYHYQI